ncbi:lysophospholipid acyltransferase family protein [Sulfitobacter mediterraneus]|jgi:lyso-ornithine lipid O-acyltransferase|uniref:Acyl-phosphate glycerol 3-phosphate acyltransferase n=1 Tax=Sulfitobacter mediterraneus TaxID=83219 RepID=A0A061SQ07_9RHOB|nr:lysophospholipid acyltransferase family protein [Sulfitobacter mediterraneus]KAJ01529.1 acyl-phosphate glycerol 3-phosphate acyltransferase [Sulfitobacter mediterraneus]UWR09611.1 1-acyl-sn-glycerol-3-phosphate acyltransferase [Sulfitobacter mediterraneus]
MSIAWDSGVPPAFPPIRFWGWVRVILRVIALGLLVFGGLLILLIVRLIEQPLYGLHRPVTPHITQFVCRNALRILGIGYSNSGNVMKGRGAVVANHSSWLDIFVLNAAKRIYFVSKSEVASWPGIGWLARATGTVFIERNPAKAKEQTQVFEARLLAGHKLLFFPEGTSTDGMQVIPFKTTLFQAFFAENLKDEIAVQPVTITYFAPEGTDPRFYGWWGDMSFGSHLLATLAPARQGRVHVDYHAPMPVRDYANRKALAQASEVAVRSGHQLSSPDQKVNDHSE